MIQGYYSGAAALHSYERRQEAFAANLSNISTTGYKRRVDSFFSQMLDGQAVRGQGVEAPDFSLTLDFSPGESVYTHNPLNIALENRANPNGNAFYTVINPEGDELYARGGRLKINDDGLLVHASSGYQLINPNGTPIKINKTGSQLLDIDPKGQVSQDRNNIGQIKTVTFGSLSNLTPIHDGLYQAGRMDQIEDGFGKVAVRQGYLESSNVNTVTELVSMLANYRAYESSQRTLRSIDQSAQQLNRIV